MTSGKSKRIAILVAIVVLIVTGVFCARAIQPGVKNTLTEWGNGLADWQATRAAEKAAKEAGENTPTASVTPAPLSTPTLVPITPTATLPPPLNANELFESGMFPGILPEFARDNAVAMSDRAGDSFTTSNGTNIGADLGWNQPFYSGDWTKFLCYQTAWCIPPGASTTFTMEYKTVILNPNGTNWLAPYNSWWNAVLIVSQERPEYSGKYVAPGLALTAPSPLTVSINYGAGACVAPSVALVPNKPMRVSLACPANSAVECVFSVGQWGEFVDIKTGKKADAEVQKYGGNTAVPGCLDPSFPGPIQWLESLK